MFDYDPVLYSRLLTFITLAFHILFATIGVGVPLMIALAHWVGLKRNDRHYLLLARRWTRGFVITVAVGVVTGTAIGMQLSLLWPSFMQLAGQAIALPLFMETFAFFFEAIFLGMYLYTWERFRNPWYHFLLLVPVAVGSSASALFITIVNAFMNTPQGFVMENGAITHLEPLVAMFNPATPTKVAHVLASAYLTSAFVLGAIAAWSLLKGKTHVYYKKALHLTMVAAFVFAVATAAVGDLSGKFLAEYQPEKLAAAEWHFETESAAPLVLGGILDESGEVRYALEIPYALSILAHGNPGAEVTGLEAFDPELRPPLSIHYYFDGMVLIGVYLLMVSALYLWVHYRRKKRLYPRWLLRSLVAGGPLALLAIELGWIFTERGRQPWILVGYMRVSEGATTSEHVGWMLLLFCLLYAVLAVASGRALLRMYRDTSAEEELKTRGWEE